MKVPEAKATREIALPERDFVVADGRRPRLLPATQSPPPPTTTRGIVGMDLDWLDTEKENVMARERRNRLHLEGTPRSPMNAQRSLAAAIIIAVLATAEVMHAGGRARHREHGLTGAEEQEEINGSLKPRVIREDSF